MIRALMKFFNRVWDRASDANSSPIYIYKFTQSIGILQKIPL